MRDAMAVRVGRLTGLRLVSAALAFGVALLMPASAWSDPLGPFATANGSCPGGISLPTATVTHESVAIRVNATGHLYVDPYIEAGDVVWRAGGKVAAGSSLPNPASCFNSSVSYTVQWYDLPVGAVSYGGSSAGYMRLPYRSPWTARWVADVQIAQGAVTLGSQTFASNGTYSIGSVDGSTSTRDLYVAAESGPKPVWTITLHPDTPYLGEVKADPTVARAGTPIRLRYSPTADMTMTASAWAVGGGLVRTLGTGFPVAAGDGSVTWDGLDGNGRPVPDGLYSLNAQGADYYGQSASGSATVRLDSTPPAVSVQTPRVASGGPVSVAISDPAGVDYDSGFVVRLDDSRTHGYYSKTDTGIVITPEESAWPYGDHKVSVTVADKLGNSGTSVGTFRQPCHEVRVPQRYRKTIRVAQRYRKTIRVRVWRSGRWRYVSRRVWRTRYVNKRVWRTRYVTRTQCD